MSPRGEAATTSVRVSNAVTVPSAQTAKHRRHVNVTLTVPQETTVSCFHRSHQLFPGSNAVSVYLTCLDCRRNVDPTDRTHSPGISRVATNGSGVVGKIATTARMMCLYLLMVGATSCLDRVVHALPVADALPIICQCVDIFHVDPRESVEQRVRRKCLMNRLDLVQHGGQVPNPKDPYTAVRRRGCKTRHVRPNRLATVSDRTKWRAILEESWRPTTLALVEQDKKSLLAHVAYLARDQHRCF